MIDIEATGDPLLGLAALLRHPAAPQRRRRSGHHPHQAHPTPRRPVASRSCTAPSAAVAAPDDPPSSRQGGRCGRGAGGDEAERADGVPVWAGLFLAMQRASLDSLAVARIAGFDSALGVVLLSRAEKLACRATELAQVIRGGRGQRRKIMIDHISHA